MDKNLRAAIYEARKMEFECTSLEHMRSKDGVHLWRIFRGDDSFVLKHFEKAEYRREIENYRLLKKHGVPTLKIYGETDCAILMEDISRSEKFRLGEERDMSDPEIAAKLARWFKKLHSIHADLAGMYDESDFFTRENIAAIKEKAPDFPVWKVLEEKFDVIKSRLDNLRRVVTYNDFYYTNLVVARDKSQAFMFDYNLLGRGYALSDVRNVTYSLSEEAAKAFTSEYGQIDPIEQLIDDVISPVITLHMAYQREKFPEWGKEALENVKNTLEEKIYLLTGMI